MFLPAESNSELASSKASWRQRMGQGLDLAWRAVLRQLKGSPQRNRYFLWIVCAWMMAMHLTHLMAKSDDTPVVWGPPIEPPGAVVVTTASSNLSMAPLQQPERAAIQSGKPGSDEAALSQPAAQGLRTTLHQWSDAWRRQDVAAYLDMYASDYVPANGISRQAWVKSRTQRISEKASIRHEIQDLNIQWNGNTAVVTFTQIYQDERVQFTDKKTMHWVQQEGVWVIASEKTA